MACFDAKLDTRFEKISNLHPCFSGGANMSRGRVHLPVSPSCNIQCKFCKRSFNQYENRPGVAGTLLSPEQAVRLVDKALALCPEITTVAGIAGPGDTPMPLPIPGNLPFNPPAPSRAHQLPEHNGLLLERYARTSGTQVCEP
jgi:nitrogen fixation protein NifB